VTAPSFSRNGGRLKGEEIVTLTAEKDVLRVSARRSPSGSPKSNPRKEVKPCVTEFYKTHSDMSDSDFTFHEIDEFEEEGNCEGGADCITPPLKRNDFVLRKLATKETLKYFVGLIQ
jgi:hypothetical protein